MFRSLRMRLVGSYVSAALLLVIVAAFGVTAFALSIFGMTTRETVDAAALAAPEEVRLQIARHGSLVAAAPDIVTRLVRPGVHVALSQYLPDGRRFVVAGGLNGAGQLDISSGLRQPAEGVGGERPGAMPPPPGMGPPDGRGGPPPGEPGMHGDRPGPGGGYHAERFSTFPMVVNLFMHVQPHFLELANGVHLAIVPDATQLAHFVGAFWLALAFIGTFVVLAAWFAGRYIAEQALRPLVETTASLNRFAAGDFTPRPIVTSDRGEIGELVTAYNGAVKQVAAAFEERRSVEMQMRQFVADAGHELRTPLTVIMGFIDVLRRRGTSDPVASGRIFDTMQAESRRMRALIDKLIALARLENPQRRDSEPVEVAALAQRVVDALQALQDRPRIALHAERGLIVRGDEHELHEALSNLVENALKYAPGSPVDIDARADGSAVVLKVSDRGPGLSAQDREHIFDRFYRGENRGETEGFGLGLAIVKRAVERAGGEVSVDSTEGKGATFTIRLPRQPGEPARIAV